MKKIKHKYISKGYFPLNIISFIIEIDGRKYGYYEKGIREEDKFKLLRNFVLEKHKMIENIEFLKKEWKEVSKFKQEYLLPIENKEDYK